MPSDLDLLLQDLKLILSRESIPDHELPQILNQLSTIKARTYLSGLHQAKPETFASDFFFRPILDNLKLSAQPQIKAGNGWVDFLIGGYRNPVAIELKPLHKVRRREGTYEIVKNKLEDVYNFLSKQSERDNQIITYLRGYDYVILTNLEEVYYFNREAIIEFKPFFKEDFFTFLENIKAIKDIWEVVRRKEDQVPKHELDKAFFNDLKRWYLQLDRVKWKGEEEEVKEIKILLLNMFIFIQTLEDYGLIPFKFLQDTYTDKTERWKTKGAKKILQKFFKEIREWFYQYYDTELFKRDILSYIEDSERNYKEFLETIETIVGFGVWNKAFGKGLSFYNYRYIDEDIFGKSYETFLAENRKGEGIYYTPALITKYMARNLVEEVFKKDVKSLLKLLDEHLNDTKFSEAKEIAERITKKSIIDIACGSGSFLIKVLREIYFIYDLLDEKTKWVVSTDNLILSRDISEKRKKVGEIRNILGLDTGDKRKLISLVILRHIYGIDLDNGALDVAKVNIWKEAIKLHPDLFRYDKLPSDKNHILPDLETNLIRGNSLYSLPDDIVIEEMEKHFKSEIIDIIQKRNEYLKDPFNPDIVEYIKSLKSKIKQYLYTLLKNKGWDFEFPVFYPLEFPQLYFNEEGNPLEEKGFDGIIGNPPWENIKPSKKEFASKYPDIFGEVTKFSLSGKEFEKLFYKKLKENPQLCIEWENYVEKIRAFSEFIRNNYYLYGSGDLSFQKVFLEKALNLSKHAICILIPSNFHTDEGTYLLRREIMENYHLEELLSFENRKHNWFKDIDPRFKFDIVFVVKIKEQIPFKAKFYITEWNEVQEAFEYPMDIIPLLSPTVLGIFEFRNTEDIELAKKIRGNYPLFVDIGYRLFSEFHMSNDKSFFNTSNKGLMLYEGKMIHQYRNDFSAPTYWIEEREGRSELLRKELKRIDKLIKRTAKIRGLEGKKLREFRNTILNEAKENFENKKWKLDYEVSRFAYRAIASSTNERTLIATVLPERVFAGNSIILLKSFYYEIQGDEIIQIQIPDSEIYYLTALFNSFVLDYYIRLRVSANLNMFFVYELPIPQISTQLKNTVTNLVVNLLNVPNDKNTRAELEYIIARDIFKLEKQEFEYILSTFIYGNPDRELMDLALAKY